jgi:hypothetical protein
VIAFGVGVWLSLALIVGAASLGLYELARSHQLAATERYLTQLWERVQRRQADDDNRETTP